MIVDPDFFDHWKTILLIDELDGDQAAPVYVLRLWAHCQNRRAWVFDSLSEKALKALCRFPGHANKLVAGLVASGFVRVEDSGQVTIVGWDEYNASLIANWTNGSKGGRPKSATKKAEKKADTPLVEDSKKPMGSPSVAHCKAIGGDRRGLDKNKPTHTPAEGFEKDWQRWCDYRESVDSRRIDPIQADAILMDLARRGPEKAAADIDFSIRKGARSILDSDHDFEKNRARSRPSGQRAKVELDL